jgi:hypothetical protein
MRYYRSFEEHNIQPRKSTMLRDIAVFFLAFCVIGTTLLNVAFTLAPIPMTHLIKAIMA